MPICPPAPAPDFPFSAIGAPPPGAAGKRPAGLCQAGGAPVPPLETLLTDRLDRARLACSAVRRAISHLRIARPYAGASRVGIYRLALRELDAGWAHARRAGNRAHLASITRMRNWLQADLRRMEAAITETAQ